jgi:nitrite reductase (NADH) small subunit
VVVEGRNIAIFNLGERLPAVDDRYPHRGGPLSEGLLSGKTVVCPLHATKIDLESGAVANPGSSLACVAKFGTRVVAGTVERRF